MNKAIKTIEFSCFVNYSKAYLSIVSSLLMIDCPKDPVSSVAFYCITECLGEDLDPTTVLPAVETIKRFVEGKGDSYEQSAARVKALIGTDQPLSKINLINLLPDEPFTTDEDDDEGMSNGRHKAKMWVKDEDNRLLGGIMKFGTENWLAVSNYVGNGRTRSQCSQRWIRGLNPHIYKGPWSADEEKRLLDLIAEYGEKSWTKVAALLGNRCDVQCRYHYQMICKEKDIIKDNYYESSSDDAEIMPKKSRKITETRPVEFDKEIAKPSAKPSAEETKSKKTIPDTVDLMFPAQADEYDLWDISMWNNDSSIPAPIEKKTVTKTTPWIDSYAIEI